MWNPLHHGHSKVRVRSAGRRQGEDGPVDVALHGHGSVVDGDQGDELTFPPNQLGAGVLVIHVAEDPATEDSALVLPLVQLDPFRCLFTVHHDPSPLSDCWLKQTLNLHRPWCNFLASASHFCGRR